jgi:hypothetical protein
MVTKHNPVLALPWKVAEKNAPIKIFYRYDNTYSETEAEDLCIVTAQDNIEVIGCSEWMRADPGIFEHIVTLHNASLTNPPNA